jgi:putative flippase GtrA
MKKILAISIIIFAFIFNAGVVFADYGLRETGTAAGVRTTGSVSGIAGNVIGAGLTMVGVLFLILMIYGGIMWMLARGNEETSRKALNTIIAAIVGLIIVTASYAITTFVFQSVEDAPATEEVSL